MICGIFKRTLFASLMQTIFKDTNRKEIKLETDEYYMMMIMMKRPVETIKDKQQE